jgi:hypothetical protein
LELTLATGVLNWGKSKILEGCFDDGELMRDEYAQFCKSGNRQPELGEDEADEIAGEFFEFKWGQDFCVIKMPPDRRDTRAAYQRIVEFARRHGLAVCDPQVGNYIALDNPGEFPPMLGGAGTKPPAI